MTREEMLNRTTWSYLRTHGGNTGLTLEQYLSTVDDPDLKEEIKEWCETVNDYPISERALSQKKNPDEEYERLLHEDARHWQKEYGDLYIEGLEEIKNNQSMILETPQKKSEIKRQLSPDSIRPALFEIRMVYYPYADSVDRYELHPSFMIPQVTEAGLAYRFIFVTSARKTNPIFTIYDVPLTDWKETGLLHLSYARMDRSCFKENIIFTSKSIRPIGLLSKNDKNKCRNMRAKFNSEIFKHPVAFMGWLIDNRISDPIPVDGGNNNNVNAIQTIEDIDYTKTANCVDIAIVSYKMTKNVKDISSATISSVTWPIKNKPGSSNGHIFMMFKIGKFTYVFDYDQEHYTGTFRYWYGLDYLEVATKFSNMIRKLASNKDIRNSDPGQQKVIILTPDQLNELDDLSHFKTQRDWLRSIKSEDMNPVKEHTFFNSLSTLDKMIFNHTFNMKKAGH